MNGSPQRSTPPGNFGFPDVTGPASVGRRNQAHQNRSLSQEGGRFFFAPRPPRCVPPWQSSGHAPPCRPLAQPNLAGSDQCRVAEAHRERPEKLAPSTQPAVWAWASRSGRPLARQNGFKQVSRSASSHHRQPQNLPAVKSYHRLLSRVIRVVWLFPVVWILLAPIADSHW